MNTYLNSSEDYGDSNLTQDTIESAEDDIIDRQARRIQEILDKNEILNTNAFNSTNLKEEDKFVESFWYWSSFNSYLMTLLCMVVALTLLTFVFRDNSFFVWTLGILSSFIEAFLGVP